jgi:hypothetical protein
MAHLAFITHLENLHPTSMDSSTLHKPSKPLSFSKYRKIAILFRKKYGNIFNFSTKDVRI